MIAVEDYGARKMARYMLNPPFTETIKQSHHCCQDAHGGRCELKKEAENTWGVTYWVYINIKLACHVNTWSKLEHVNQC